MISQGGVCTNPLKCYGTLSCTSLNKSYFYPSVGSHYLRVGIFFFLFWMPKLIQVGSTLEKKKKTTIIDCSGRGKFTF